MNQNEFKQYIKKMVDTMLEKVPSYHEQDFSNESDNFLEHLPDDLSGSITDEVYEDISEELNNLEQTLGFGDEWGNMSNWGDLMDWAGDHGPSVDYGNSCGCQNDPWEGSYGPKHSCDEDDSCNLDDPFDPSKAKKHYHHQQDDRWLKCFIFTCVKLKIILCLLKHRRFGLKEIKQEVASIETAIFSPTFGLKEIKREIRNIERGIFNPTFSISEIKAEISNIESAIFSETFGLSEIKVEVSDILAIVVDIVTNPVFGISEIKAEVSNIESAIFSESFGLSEIKAETSDILSIVSSLDVVDLTSLLSDIKSEISAIQSAVFNGTFGLEEIKSEVSTIESAVFSDTFGLAEIKSEVSFLLSITDAGSSGNTLFTTGPFTTKTGENAIEVQAFNTTSSPQSVTFYIREATNCVDPDSDALRLELPACCGTSGFFGGGLLPIIPIIAGNSYIIFAETSSTFGISLYALGRTQVTGVIGLAAPGNTEFQSTAWLPTDTICTLP